MSKVRKHQIIILLLGLVWLVNGLFCKILDLVPRHEEIVAVFFGEEHARLMTVIIGLSEVLLAIAIWLQFKRRWINILQVTLVLSMNFLELIFAQDLLLWNWANSIFALLFCLFIVWHELQMTNIS